jgi:hypothetical protein
MSDSRPREQHLMPFLLRCDRRFRPWGAHSLVNEVSPTGIFPGLFYIAAEMLTAQVGGSRPAPLSLARASALPDDFHLPPERRYQRC